MSNYIFESHQNDLELKRLKGLEAAFDPHSISCLQKVGLKPGGRCLEIGPGAGSLMQWMGQEVGSSGFVLGIDRNARYLEHLNKTPFSVIEGDFSEVDFEEGFDLIHARYVLIHNRNATALLERIKKKLKPGGTIVLEEPDFRCAVLLNDPTELSQMCVNRAISSMFESLVLNPSYGVTLPKHLLDLGFTLLDVATQLHFVPGASPVARVMAASADALREKYIETGEASEADIQSYITHASDERYCTVYYATISVTASLPI